jgi:hypothetical protein
MLDRRSLIAATSPRQARRRLSRAQYMVWLKQACWDRLRYTTVGRSFCDYFAIKDEFLLHTADEARHWEHIQTHYR